MSSPSRAGMSHFGLPFSARYSGSCSVSLLFSYSTDNTTTRTNELEKQHYECTVPSTTGTNNKNSATRPCEQMARHVAASPTYARSNACLSHVNLQFRRRLEPDFQPTQSSREWNAMKSHKCDVTKFIRRMKSHRKNSFALTTC